MEPVIIALSGRKGAGKNTIGTFIQQWFADNCDGSSMECSFADTLKDFCVETLGLDKCQCYGTDDEKNTPTEYNWDNVPRFLRWKFGNDVKAKEMVLAGATTDEVLQEFYDNWEYPSLLKSGQMTGREIMQLFGTDLIRQTFGNVWASATIRRINASGKRLAVITDNRFPNEVETVLKEPRGFIIRLTRSPYGKKDVHPSESALDSFDWTRDRCYTLDNEDLDMEQQNDQVVPILKDIFESGR